MLLIQRAATLKRAANKAVLAAEILAAEYQSGHHWLVYCDSQTQLDDVLRSLAARSIDADQYHSAMIGDRATTLEHFIEKGGILAAIRCLDEGVDIPAVDHALILASSRNPREFIQRRGRVLRISEGKHFAEVHDALVVPPANDGEDYSPLLRGELTRAALFAESADNDAVRFSIRSIATDYGITLTEHPDDAIEDDEADQEE
jgi:superfamily II DNA or RNA helicase